MSQGLTIVEVGCREKERRSIGKERVVNKLIIMFASYVLYNLIIGESFTSLLIIMFPMN